MIKAAMVVLKFIEENNGLSKEYANHTRTPMALAAKKREAALKKTGYEDVPANSESATLRAVSN